MCLMHQLALSLHIAYGSRKSHILSRAVARGNTDSLKTWCVGLSCRKSAPTSAGYSEQFVLGSPSCRPTGSRDRSMSKLITGFVSFFMWERRGTWDVGGPRRVVYRMYVVSGDNGLSRKRHGSRSADHRGRSERASWGKTQPLASIACSVMSSLRVLGSDYLIRVYQPLPVSSPTEFRSWLVLAIASPRIL